MGRRKATITPAALEKFAAQGLTQQEVGQLFGVTQARISQILSDPESPERIAWERGRGNLSQLLKVKQLELALNGNALMCIWLSKQYLGFADKQESHDTHDVNVNVQYIAAWGKTPQELPPPPAAGELSAPDVQVLDSGDISLSDSDAEPPSSPSDSDTFSPGHNRTRLSSLPAIEVIDSTAIEEPSSD